MRKLRRLVVIALGALIALVIVLLLGVNLYVQSQGAQAKIQQELTRSLGVPLKIRNMSVTPWGGLELSGITIPQTSPEIAPKHFLEAKTFRLRVRFLSLFSQRLVIKEVSLINPRVVWPQDAHGKWRLPSAQKVRSHAVATKRVPAISQKPAGNEVVQTNTISAATVTANLPSPPQATVKNQPAGRGPTLTVAPEVRRVSVKH